MNSDPIECNDELLAKLLCDESSDLSAKPVFDHVEHCKSCQKRLEQMAAEASDWKRIGELLSDSNLDGVHNVRTNSKVEWPSPRLQVRSTEWTDSIASQLLAPPSHPEMLGRLGRYEVERLIGAGGMGVVFKGFDTELNRPVAIKVLAPYLAGSGPARRRFAREARAAAAVVHEHVVPIHNVETEGQSPFLVMRFVNGESLQGRIDREGALELCEILRIGAQVASGLTAAHAQGLVHRDIKPSNILLEQSIERALITDFGLARATDDASLTHTGFHLGTPQYMSPEQARGDSVDSRSDLFSLGSVLYAMCTGRPPFRADSSYGVLRRITDTEPRPIREINPNIPEWLCRLIAKLMSKELDHRYPTANDVCHDLQACLAHVQQPTERPLPSSIETLVSRTIPKPTRLPRAIGLALAVASLIAVFGWIIQWELSKGTLVIQSDADDVRVRILRKGEVIQRLTVDRFGEQVRVAAGEYSIEIESNADRLAIDHHSVTLASGSKEIVRISHPPVAQDANQSTSNFSVNNGVATEQPVTATNRSTIRLLQLKRLKAGEAEEIIERHFAKASISAAFEPTTNSIVIRGPEKSVEEAFALLEDLESLSK